MIYSSASGELMQAPAHLAAAQHGDAGLGGHKG
jgi:hypothetical protein